MKSSSVYQGCLLVWIAAVLLAGCGPATAQPAPETVFVEVTRVVNVPSTPEQVEVTRAVEVTRVIEVTRVVEATRPVAMAVTPTPGPVDACYQTALTSVEINGCAALDYDLAAQELEGTVQQVMALLTPDEQKLLVTIQQEWKTQMERDCTFFYGQTETTSDGGLFYKNGSMAPMLVSGCKAEMTQERSLALREAYLCENYHCGD